MRHFLHGLTDKYFAHHLSRPLKELYASAAILTFAIAAVTLFEPIYLYHRIGLSLAEIFLFYAAVYVGYFFALPLGAKAARAIGYERAMFISSPFLILYYFSLFALPFNRIFFVTAVVSFILQKIFYWPAYHADFARHGERVERGRQITTMGLVLTGAGLLGPFFGGLIIAAWGFRVLFLIVAVLVLFSNIPMLSTSEHFIPVKFSYRDAWRRLFAPAFRKKCFAGLCYTEDLLVMVAWPIFLFSIVPVFHKLGAIVSVVSLGVALLVLTIGRLTDSMSREKLLRTGMIFTVGAWLSRPFLFNPISVFLSDLWYRVSRSMIGIPLAASVYDRAKETSVMETVVAYEMALSFGKAFGAFAGAFLAVNFASAPWTPIFILAAVSVFGYGFLLDRTRN